MTAGRSINTNTQDWGTPKKYVEAVRKFFNGRIDLDPCSNQYSIVQANTEYCLPTNDGLKESWNFPNIYVNPPYGKDKERGTRIADWLEQCVKANLFYGSEVLALVPVATNTNHWKKYVFGQATAICFLYDTRLRFLVEGKDEGKGAPMSCAMVYWGNKYEKFFDIFIQFGAVVDLRPLIDQPIGNPSQFMQISFTEAIMNHSTGDTYNVSGQAGVVGKNANATNNNFFQSQPEKQTLAEAAKEIEQLLKQLEKNYPNATEEEKIAYINDETSPGFKRRTAGALKALGESVLDEYVLDSNLLKVFKATIKGWVEPE